MLPIVLVLLVASSVLAAPGINLAIGSINDVAPAKGPSGAFQISDGGDANVYTLILTDFVKDLSNRGDQKSQALALSQTIAVLAAVGNGVPGDACASAKVIEEYLFALNSGNLNNNNLRAAVSAYTQSLVNGIDTIVQLANNPTSARFSTGPRGNCSGGGRTYNFEAAWNSILSSASPNTAGLIKEEYCAAKRLYNAFNVRSNNVGAAVTAASLPPVTRVIREALGPVSVFVRSIARGDAAGTAVAAKKALLRAANAY